MSKNPKTFDIALAYEDKLGSIASDDDIGIYATVASQDVHSANPKVVIQQVEAYKSLYSILNDQQRRDKEAKEEYLRTVILNMISKYT